MTLSRKERILIVDDTPVNIDVLGAILMADYDISVAVNGPMALDIVDSGLIPDLVLLDIMMPEMDGYEVAQKLKADTRTKEVPVIFVTAKIEDEDEAHGFRVGAVDYIRKPVNSDVTLARVRPQLELKRFRDHLAGEVLKKDHQVSASQKALAYPVKIENQIQGVFVFYENISQRKKFENKLKHQAFHDALTGIPNRLLFSEHLEFAIIEQDTSPDYKFAVLLIDLDRFKSVNDTLGHQAGDDLLKAVSGKIQSRLRKGDTLARMGGDEFAVILAGVRDDKQVTTVATRIRLAVESDFFISGHEVHISASIGIVYHTRAYTRAEQLLRDADLAMYQAKDAGKAGFKFFTPGMRKDLLERMAIEKEMRTALDKKEFSLVFQPIVRVADSRICGLEALIRWQHPEKGLIPPDRFIPIAEETGLIIPMGDWIIFEACRILKMLNHPHGPDLTMSINISIKQFLKPSFVARLARQVDRAGISPAQVKLEFTESMLMANTVSAVEKLNTLKSMGFVLVIDDFGTGYSSLSYLQQFPIDQVKIDRSFIDSMGEKRESMAIVSSILSLAKGLGLTTVAEGVETSAQLKKLANMDCEFAQGYYFSRPCPPDHLKL